EGSAHARYRTVLRIGENSAIRESQRDFAAGAHLGRQRNKHEQMVLVVPLERQWPAIRSLDVANFEVWMELDAQIARGLDRPELNFGNGRNALSAGINRGADIVVLGDEIESRGRLGTRR